MNENRFYVYQYLNPHTRLPFYIGKGTGRRCYQHLSDKKEYCRNKRLNGTIRNLIENCTPPIIEIIQNNMSNKDALSLEQSLVLKYGRKGIDANGILMNILDGGLATPIMQGKDHPWYGRKHSMESKAKMSKTLLKRYKSNPKLCGFLGKKHSMESKAKMRKFATGRKQTTETIQKRVKSMTGFKQSENQKLKASKALSKDWLLVNPDGETFLINNLSKWAKENFLDQGNLVKVSQGKCKHHKGWKCQKL